MLLKSNPRLWIALWCIVGVELILADALYRLLPRALAPLLEKNELPLGVQLTYVGSILFLGFFEGYKGFQKSFSPRVAARALHLAHFPTPKYVVLGPLYAMALMGTTRRRWIASWALVLGVIFLIVAVHQLPELYRAAVDAGVVVGLSWGALSILTSFWSALRRGPQADPEIPRE